MIEVINSGTGIEIRKGTLRGAGHVLYFNQGGDERGVFMQISYWAIFLKLVSYLIWALS